MRRRLCCLLVLMGLAAAGGAQEEYVPQPAGTLNFAEHIAPIVFQHCLRCHGADPSAPFPLVDYASVRRRGREISMVTKEGAMPPALAEPGYGDIVNSGRLSAQEIGLIGQWVREGRKQGDPEKTPEPPALPKEWKLGPPDLIVGVEEPFEVPADAFGLSRNFVLPLTLDSDRRVRAFALRRHSPTFLRAYLYFDPTGSTANLESEDIDGVVTTAHQLSFAAHPAYGGQQLVTKPWPLPTTVAQLLTPGTSLVLQLHFQATGLDETVQPEVGLYFADEAPSQTLVTLSLGSAAFSIPAEDTDFHIKSSFTLPVSTAAVGVLPNAHWVAVELKAWATLPDGSEEGLVWIKDWDYSHQKQYWYGTPIELPAGTVVEMDFRYDNSSDNFNNPNYPPAEMSWGLGLHNELAGLNLQLVLSNDDDLVQLNEAYAEYLER